MTAAMLVLDRSSKLTFGQSSMRAARCEIFSRRRSRWRGGRIGGKRTLLTPASRTTLEAFPNNLGAVTGSVAIRPYCRSDTKL